MAFVTTRLVSWASDKALSRLHNKSGLAMRYAKRLLNAWAFESFRSFMLAYRSFTIYACVGGHGLAALAVMLHGQPWVVNAQMWMVQAMMTQLGELGFNEISFNSPIFSSALVVFAIIAVFCAVSWFQAAASNLLLLLDPDRQWLQKQQDQVRRLAGFMLPLAFTLSTSSLVFAQLALYLPPPPAVSAARQVHGGHEQRQRAVHGQHCVLSPERDVQHV